MNPKDKKYIITIAVITVLSIAGFWTWMLNSNNADPILAEVPNSESQSEVQNETNPKPEYDIPPIQPPKEQQSKSGVDNNGEVIISKPQEPEKPAVKDKNQITDPSKPPEYNQEDVKPEPPKDTTPKPGDKNNKGEIYVPGFGWVADHGGGDDGHSIIDAGGDPNKQVGIM